MTLIKEIAKASLAAINKPLARRRFARALTASPRPYKFEVGAAQIGHAGWLTSDITWRTRHYMDATTAWPVPDRSASHVYADNVIEHIRMEPNRKLLREAFRVLQPGGGIRLVTPDVGRLVQLYLRNDAETRWHFEHATRKGYEAHHPVDLLRMVFQDAGHHIGYLWDYEALAAELAAAGFVLVVRCEAGESPDPDFVGLESRASHEGSPIELVVEARRPSDLCA